MWLECIELSLVKEMSLLLLSMWKLRGFVDWRKDHRDRCSRQKRKKNWPCKQFCFITAANEQRTANSLPGDLSRNDPRKRNVDLFKEVARYPRCLTSALLEYF